MTIKTVSHKTQVYLRPLPIKPFKSSMKDKCSDYYDTADELTSNGNFKRATYGSAVNWAQVASQKSQAESPKLVLGMWLLINQRYFTVKRPSKRSIRQ